MNLVSATTDTAGLQLAAQAAIELDKRARESKWQTDPWSWYQDRMQLLDPLATGQQVAPFPDFPYLRALIDDVAVYNALIVWKSRRMIASWTLIGWAVRLCTLFPNQRCYFVAKREGETDSDGCRELVWRAKWVAQNLRNGPIPKMEAGKLHVLFPDTGSTITGVSGEPNALRQVSANFVLGDEMGFWERPREAYAALKPTLEARGKFVGISSSAEGFFKELVRDEVEQGGGAGRGGVTSTPGQGVQLTSRDTDKVIDEEFTSTSRSAAAEAPGNAKSFQGYTSWTNKFNKFRICAIHYTADPRKRNPEWLAREKEGVPLSIWLKEYEMQFNVNAGRPVYLHEWRPQTMLVEGLKTERNRPILCGLDFGYHHPCLLVAQMRYGLQLCVLRMFQGRELRFEDFMNQVLTSLAQWFPQRVLTNPADVLWCCDASGDQEQATGGPEVKILRRIFNIKPKFRKVKIPPTIDIVRGYMSRTYRGEPCFLVDNNDSMQLFLDGLNGGYAYPEGEINEDTRPEKDNIHDHAQDICRYIAVNFGTAQNRTNTKTLDRIARADILTPTQYI